MDILIENVSKSFEKEKVIDSISLKIPSGSFTTLLGPSGCGKTTLLRMISGLETPDEGKIMLGSKTVFSSEEKINVPPEKRGLGFVFQDFALWPHMKVKDNVAFGLRAQKRTENLEEEVEKALSSVRLTSYKERYPRELSGGQQQRVSFARAIATKPECILFDEPLSALDAILREEMRGEIKRLCKEYGLTSIFVTHDQSEAMSMSDMIAVIEKGKVLQYDNPERIYHYPTTPFAAKFIGSSNWIDDGHMFRPENIHYEKRDGDIEFVLPVEDYEYLGSYYRLILDYKGRRWSARNNQKVEKGTKLPIYIQKDSIIEFGR